MEKTTKHAVLALSTLLSLYALYTITKKNGGKKISKNEKSQKSIDIKQNLGLKEKEKCVEVVLIEILQIGSEKVASWYGNRSVVHSADISVIQSAANERVEVLVASRGVSVASVELFARSESVEALWDRAGGVGYDGFALERLGVSATGWSVLETVPAPDERILGLFTLEDPEDSDSMDIGPKYDMNDPFAVEFSKIDIDHDGFLTRKEVKLFLKNSGVPPKQIQAKVDQVFAGLDEDRDDMISFDEFVAAGGLPKDE